MIVNTTLTTHSQLKALNLPTPTIPFLIILPTVRVAKKYKQIRVYYSQG